MNRPIDVELPQSKSLGYFWRAVAAGRPVTPPSPEEIDAVLDRETPSEPLTELTNEERENVRLAIRQTLESQGRSLANFYTTNFVLTKAKNNDDPYFVPVHAGNVQWPNDARRKRNATPIPQAKVVEMMSDPATWRALRFPGGTRFYYGQRALHEYTALHDILIEDDRKRVSEARQEWIRGDIEYDDYIRTKDGIVRAETSKYLERLKSRTGAATLNALDVGGGMGIALTHLREIDPTIVTHDLTVNEEVAMYPVDRLVLTGAEQMPREWNDEMHLIVSNYAYQYFPYPDIGLLNIVKALAVNGEAHVSMDTEGGSGHVNSRRLKAMCHLLQELISSGAIAVEQRAGEPFPMGTLKDRQERSLLWANVVHVRKLRSIEAPEVITHAYRAHLKRVLEA